MNSAKDLIAQLKGADQETIKVFVPSLQAWHPFTPISVKQQKELIKQSLNGLIGTLKLTLIFNHVLRDNNVDKVPLIITDRNAILVQLRVASLGLVAYDSASNKQTLKNDVEKPAIWSESETSANGVVVKLRTPSIDRDNLYFTNLIKQLEQNSIKSDELIVKVYTSEIAKFIDTISFNGVDYENTGILPEEVIESLPTTLINAITGGIRDVKDYDNTFIQFENDDFAILNARFFCDTI